MEIVIRCSVCGLKMIIEEVASSKKNCGVVVHVSPCPCSSNLTKRAVDVATLSAPDDTTGAFDDSIIGALP